MERNKQTILASGIDPELKKLRQLQAIRSNTQKKYIRALESIEDYWERVLEAAEGQACK